MNACPCCASPLLRHIRHHQIYWFCRSCWQEMPLLKSPFPLPLGVSPFTATLEHQMISNALR